MPYFPGHWFPERDDDFDNSLYHASMLALLKPWRSLRDLKVMINISGMLSGIHVECSS
jgi:hypothetical protein